MQNPFTRKTRLDGRYNLDTTESPYRILRAQTGIRVPAPIVSVSVGTTGMTRTAYWWRKMAALGCIDRIQSMGVYDFNSTSILAWNKACQLYGLQDISITPQYLPLSEGFLRQPDDYLSHAGPIERDMEQFVDRMEELATRAGSRPQVVLEWIGFGGHAKLSNMLHEMVVERFGNAQVLPIYCIPAEGVLEANIRDYDLWNESVKMVGKGVALMTDNRTTANLSVLDERIALGLSAVESAFRFRPDSGTLAEVVATFNLSGSRWMSLDTTDMAFPTMSEMRKRFSFRRNGATDATKPSLAAMAQAVKLHVWDIAMPANNENHTGFFVPSQANAEQRIFIILPFHQDIVDEIRNDVQDQLQREEFKLVYPRTEVHFGAGDARWMERRDSVFGHLVKLAGLPPDPAPVSLTRVLNADDKFRGRRRQFRTRGEMMAEQLNKERLEKERQNSNPPATNGD